MSKYKVILSLPLIGSERIISTLPDGYKEIRNDWNFKKHEWEDVVIYDRKLTKEEMNRHKFLYVLKEVSDDE